MGSWNSVFAIPTDVVDKHIKLAGAAQLKVLLFLLRYSGNDFTSEDIAEKLSMHPADVNDALQYWVETNILQKNQNVMIPATQVQPSEIKVVQNLDDSILKDQAQSINLSRPLSRHQKPDSLCLSKRIQESSDIAYLMQEAQVILGKTLSHGDSATLLMLHDTDGLPVDVIIMLLQYAASIHKTNMRYIEKTGIQWAIENIDNIQKVEEKLKSLSLRQKAWETVQHTMGLNNHSPTANELKYSEKWVNRWQFNQDMLREAYERCVDNTGKFNFKYADKIFQSWYNNNIKTIEAALEEKQLSNYKIKKYNQNDVSYNIDEYEHSNIFGD